mmetsp:Transcript_97755/g.174156  ORF Transcript_97755/g.174156 Transcript_97755/m.174156 type:complete len:359 (+) Transcript_97755:79-1155(+)
MRCPDLHFWTAFGVEAWKEQLEKVAAPSAGRVLLPSQRRALISFLNLKGKDPADLLKRLAADGHIAETSQSCTDESSQSQSTEALVAEDPDDMEEAAGAFAAKYKMNETTHAFQLFSSKGEFLEEGPEGPEDFPVKLVCSKKVKMTGREITVKIFKDGQYFAIGFPVVIGSAMYVVTAASAAWDKDSACMFEYKMAYGRGNVDVVDLRTTDDGSIIEDGYSAELRKFPPFQVHPEAFFASFDSLSVTVVAVSQETVHAMKEKDLPSWPYDVDLLLETMNEIKVCQADSPVYGQLTEEVEDDFIHYTGIEACMAGAPGYMEEKGVVAVHTARDESSGISTGTRIAAVIAAVQASAEVQT